MPISILRRKTIVNFGIADETQARLPMIGMRLAQQLDASIQLAAAECDSDRSAGPVPLDLIKQFTAGDRDDVAAAMRDLMTAPPAAQLPNASEHHQGPRPRDGEQSRPVLDRPGAEGLLATMLQRLRYNFTLYCLLKVEDGRHRVLTLSFEEPTNWNLQKPVLDSPQLARPSDVPDSPGAEVDSSRSPEGRSYTAGGAVQPLRRTALLSLIKLGVLPARFRFQVPSAENAASYHFEATSPPGIRIVRASLLAGRPNESEPTASIDRIVGVTPTVGLHAVEVPSQSLCRVQLDLRVPVRGWLTQLVVSCLVIMVVVCFVALHGSWAGAAWTDAVTNVVVLLVAVSAATATLVSQRDFQGLAATMVTGLRAFGVVSLVLPIIDAGCLVFATSPVLLAGDRRALQRLIDAAAYVSVVTFLIPTLALILSARDERTPKKQHSPWDIADERDSAEPVSRCFQEALEAMHFDRPAYGIQSTEGWYSRYDWTQARQQRAVTALQQRLVADESIGGSTGIAACHSLTTVCSRSELCPSKTSQGSSRFRPTDEHK